MVQSGYGFDRALIPKSSLICVASLAQWITRLTTDLKIPGSTPGLLDGVLVAQKYLLCYCSKKMPSTTPNYSKGSLPVECRNRKVLGQRNLKGL